MAGQLFPGPKGFFSAKIIYKKGVVQRARPCFFLKSQLAFGSLLYLLAIQTPANHLDGFEWLRG